MAADNKTEGRRRSRTGYASSGYTTGKGFDGNIFGGYSAAGAFLCSGK